MSSGQTVREARMEQGTGSDAGGGPMRVARTAPVALRHGSGITANPAATYFETFAPVEESGRPAVVMVHGGSHSGSCWMLTPDGRPGWAYDFVARGYTVVVPDWPGVGRSGAIPADRQDFGTVRDGLGAVVAQADAGAGAVLLTHSMGGAVGWAVAEACREQISAVVAVAPGPPGNIQPEPEVLGSDATTVEVRTPHRRVSLPRAGFVENDAAFVDGKLIGASRHFPREAQGLYGSSLLVSSAALVRQRLNVAGSQVRVRDPGCFAGLPVLVVTGSEDLEHPRETDEAIVDWLRENGAAAEFNWLADSGIEGNGHMLMLERNSRVVAELVCDWLDEKVG